MNDGKLNVPIKSTVANPTSSEDGGAGVYPTNEDGNTTDEGKDDDKLKPDSTVDDDKPKPDTTTGGGDDGAGDDGAGDEEVVVDIDGVEYSIDKDGNAVDKDGKIFKTKSELDAMSPVDGGDDGDDDSGGDSTFIDINTVIKDLELSITDEEGNPRSFDNTKEGLTDLIQEVFNRGVTSTQVSAREQMIKDYPQLADVINYISVNGSLEGYDTGSVSYANMELDKENKNQLISVVRKARALKGDTEAEINHFIGLVNADNSLYDVAQSSLEYIKGTIGEEERVRNEQAAEAEQQKLDEYNNWLNSIKSTVQKGKLQLHDKELPIPLQFKVKTKDGQQLVRNREEFVDYMTREKTFKLKDGSRITATQFEVDRYVESANLGYNKDVYDALRLFTGGDLTSIIDKSAETKRVNDIKKKVIKLTSKSPKKDTGSKGMSQIKLPVQKQI